MVTRVILIFLAVVMLAGIPGIAVADDDEDDLTGQLPDPELQYVNAATAWYASIRAKLAPLRGALAAPEFVTSGEWSSLGAGVAAAGESIPAPPPVFGGMAEVHKGVRNAAAALGGASASGPTHPDAGLDIIEMAVQLADINSATERLEGTLGAAEALLALIVSIRVEDLALQKEQEEQVETATGLTDLFGISLNPWDYCFIATAAYGTPAAREIQVLRDFRDDVLLKSSAGQDMVGFYYAASPPMADYIAAHEWLRTVVREVLIDPIVWLVEQTRILWNPAATR